MKPDRRRDNQQWILDWLVKTTGRVQNFAYDQRVFPTEVKSYRMIPRVVEKYARHYESMARAAESSGHVGTARELYWNASERYREAQHAIFQDDNTEKIYLHGKLLECFDKVMRLADSRIERVEIPFEDTYIQGILHFTADAESAPTVVFCPGMDLTKEARFNPFNHPFTSRGLNCLHIDGPGQGTSNIRKIRVTVGNYERAVSAAFDYLCSRPDVGTEQLAVSGFSMGSYWGMRAAAADSRVQAVATAAANYGPKTAIFEEASPRFKQVFMYMAGIHDEDEFDRMAESMTLAGLEDKITCPTLMVAGEYDPLAHLEDVVSVFDKLAGPKELWVVENDFHNPWGTENFGRADFFGYLADWINDALAGRKPEHSGKVIVVSQKSGLGPYTKECEPLLLPGRTGGVSAGPSKLQLGPLDSVPS